jgi:hydrogen cyanide synthase HcnC
MRRACDIAVIGGGLVGSALALGFARGGAKVIVCDGTQDDFHASVANFGLVWVQGKGLGAPDYAALSRRSANAWGDFAAQLTEAGGIDLQYRRSGGVKLALGEAELETFAGTIARMHNQPGGDNDTRIIDRKTLDTWFTGLGPDVAGAAYCPHDGHADPLSTLRALRAALAPDVTTVPQQIRRIVSQKPVGFLLEGETETLAAEQVVLAAGLGNAELAPMLGLDARVRPQRGQILVTERLPEIIPMACHTIRQTGDGTIMIGDSKEEVGFDRGTTQATATQIARRAMRMFPALADAALVRSWGGLRVMSPDGLPIYQESESHPGAFLITCHSGVTLAAAHAGEVAQAIMAGRLNETYPAFSQDRFKEAA